MPHDPKKARQYLTWLLASLVLGTGALLVYCFFLFQDLQTLMGQAPESHPSIIYSDAYLLRVGVPFANTFLGERLHELQIPFTQTGDLVQWRGRTFDFPAALVPPGFDGVARTDDLVTVNLQDQRISAIAINGRSVPSVLLEPEMIAQLAGAQLAVRDYLRLDQIPTQISTAIIAIEDQRFLQHIGFDPRSLVRALWMNIRYRSLAQGGSTITQQLVKNLLESRQKTLFRKVRELILAILMEVKFSKDEILEKYLNEVYFGQIGSLEVHGVSEAAKYFFRKPLDRLSLAEMALIAGTIRGPAAYSPYKHLERALDRKNTVLRKMAELGLITNLELQVALIEKLELAPPSSGGNRAPYFTDYVKAQALDELKDKISAEDLSNQGLRIFTTLDLPLQKIADKAVRDQVAELQARYKIQSPLQLEGLCVVADPKTGFVKALVGGRSYQDTTFNRVLNMKRQVGSTFKPVVYLAAFVKTLDPNGVPYNENYPVDDAPWTYTYPYGTGTTRKWSPHNYEKGYRGAITLKTAFENSLNIPTAKIAMDVGLDNIIETARKLGITSDLPAVPALSLGAVELNAMEVLQAYSTFANKGEKVELTTIRAIADPLGARDAHSVPQIVKAFDESKIEPLNALLHGVTVEGTAKMLPQLGYTKTAYGKTGTTSFYRDAWFAGFSEGLSAVTWVGFDELGIPADEDEEGALRFKSPANLTGAGAALPVWARFFSAAKPAAISE